MVKASVGGRDVDIPVALVHIHVRIGVIRRVDVQGVESVAAQVDARAGLVDGLLVDVVDVPGLVGASDGEEEGFLV